MTIGGLARLDDQLDCGCFVRTGAGGVYAAGNGFLRDRVDLSLAAENVRNLIREGCERFAKWHRGICSISLAELSRDLRKYGHRADVRGRIGSRFFALDRAQDEL